MKGYLEKLLNDEVLKPSGFDSEIFDFILFSNFVKYGSYDVVIYGAGGSGCAHIPILRRSGIFPKLIIDADITKHDTTLFGIEVVHTEKAHEYMRDMNPIALVCTLAYENRSIAKKIDKFLYGCGCKEIFRGCFTFCESEVHRWRQWY